MNSNSPPTLEPGAKLPPQLVGEFDKQVAALEALMGHSHSAYWKVFVVTETLYLLGKMQDPRFFERHGDIEGVYKFRNRNLTVFFRFSKEAICIFDGVFDDDFSGPGAPVSIHGNFRCDFFFEEMAHAVSDIFLANDDWPYELVRPYLEKMASSRLEIFSTSEINFVFSRGVSRKKRIFCWKPRFEDRIYSGSRGAGPPKNSCYPSKSTTRQRRVG